MPPLLATRQLLVGHGRRAILPPLDLELQADAGDYGDLPLRIARLSHASGG